MRRKAALCRELPLRRLLRSHRSAVLTSMIGTCSLIAMIVVVILMTPALLQHSFGLPAHLTQAANLAGAAGLCIGNISVGAAADRFGTRRVAVPIFLLLIAATCGLYLGAAYRPDLVVPLYLLAGFGAGASVIAPILMVAAFPPEIRFTGVSFSYNVATAVMGGITPLLVSTLSHWNRFSPGVLRRDHRSDRISCGRAVAGTLVGSSESCGRSCRVAVVRSRRSSPADNCYPDPPKIVIPSPYELSSRAKPRDDNS